MLRADPLVLSGFHRRILQIVAAAATEYGPTGLRLMGGSALAGYYLGHRESEDLDLFGGPSLNAKDFALHLSARLEKEGFSTHPTPGAPFNQGFARVLVSDKSPSLEHTVRVDFARESAFTLEPLSPTEEGVPVASFRDLCAGKLSALSTRGELRDFIDLHAILCRPLKTGELPTDATVEARMMDLLQDVQQVDPGLNAAVVADDLSRGSTRVFAGQFPLRLLIRVTDADILHTVEIARRACVRVAARAWIQARPIHPEEHRESR